MNVILFATLSPAYAISCYPDPCDQSDLPLAPDQRLLFADLSDNSSDTGGLTMPTQDVRNVPTLPERPLPKLDAAGNRELDLSGQPSAQDNQ